MSNDSKATVVIQLNSDEVVALTKTRAGYESAKTLLSQADLGYREVSDRGRERLREFMDEYQRENFRA